MLNYKPPFLEAGDLTIFTDDLDPDTFYYACNQPVIMKDQNGDPKIDAFAILRESGAGPETDAILEASLVMDVGLEISDEQRALALKSIKKEWGKEAKSLVSAPVYSGKVFLILAAAGDEPDPKKWFVTQEVKPSIFGDNIASLVIRATGKDAQLLIAALNSDTVAASVNYELEITGIAPVFKAKMTVDWSSVYHHFEKFDKLNLIFYTDEITATVDKLTETSAIQVEIQELDPVIKADALKTLLNELKTEVIKKLFQPASSPLSASSKWEDRIANGVSRVVSAIAIGSHHIRRNIDESNLSKTIINLSQKNVKTYPFNPQALLPSLIKAAGGIKDKIKWIKLDELPFLDQKVDIRLAADTFGTTNIKSVMIDCKVTEVDTQKTKISQSFVFNNDKELAQQLGFIRDKEKTYSYQYRATIYIDSESINMPDQLVTEWRPIDNPYVYFDAPEYFETRTINIILDDTDIFEHVTVVQADLAVVNKMDKTPFLKHTYFFKKALNEQKPLTVVVSKLLPIEFDLDLTYFISASKELKSKVTDISIEIFFIPNPFENKWSVDLICNADWETTTKIILETRITDAERTDPITMKFDFTKDSTDNKLIAATSLDTPAQTFDYKVTRLTTSATVVHGPWLRNEDGILVITDQIVPERIIRVTLASAPDFTSKDIQQASVEITYEDSKNNINAVSERLIFKKKGDTVEFRHSMPDFTKKEYKYRIRAKSSSGDNYKSDWVTEKLESINVSLPENIW